MFLMSTDFSATTRSGLPLVQKPFASDVSRGQLAKNLGDHTNGDNSIVVGGQPQSLVILGFCHDGKMCGFDLIGCDDLH